MLVSISILGVFRSCTNGLEQELPADGKDTDESQQKRAASGDKELPSKVPLFLPLSEH